MQATPCCHALPHPSINPNLIINADHSLPIAPPCVFFLLEGSAHESISRPILLMGSHNINDPPPPPHTHTQYSFMNPNLVIDAGYLMLPCAPPTHSSTQTLLLMQTIPIPVQSSYRDRPPSPHTHTHNYRLHCSAPPPPTHRRHQMVTCHELSR